MVRQRKFWAVVLAVSVIMLIAYILAVVNQYSQSAFGPSFFGRGMMGMPGTYYYNQIDRGAVKLSDDRIIAAVENAIGTYGSNLEIADLFFFADSDTYASIKEKNSGRGAMELLVNPYTGYVYPEQGPNMMWNEKYGMMGRSMVGFSRGNQITLEDATAIADSYLKNAFGDTFKVMDQGHVFYGYYTFHFQKGTQPEGMLSVNAYTGDVWFHNWHGRLERVIEND